jgi:hypothetical protein
VWTDAGVAAGLLIGFTLGAVVAPVAGGAGPAVWDGSPLLGAWIGGVVAGPGARRAAGSSTPAGVERDEACSTRRSSFDGPIADVVDAGSWAVACWCRAWSSASCRR